MRKTPRLAALFVVFTLALFVILLNKVPVAFAAEVQNDELADILESPPAGMLQGIPACSNSFAKSLNKSNSVMWVDDPRYPGRGVPCCMKGLVCQSYPDYKHYVIARASLQTEYDCSKIAKDCGYTPICQVAVGEALDPTTVCTSCVPYRFTFWATVYQNNNAPAPPPPPPPPPPPYDPCRGKVCPGKMRCFEGRCIQVR